MLQRIQTVFLLLVVLLMTISLFFPVWSYTSPEGEVTHMLKAFSFVSITNGAEPETVYFPFSLIATLAIASITVAVIEIGKYKNRLLQMKLGALNALLMAGTVCLGAYFATDLMSAKEVQGAYGIGLFLPGAALICNVIANRYIRKDEKLVRSVDRIR